MTNNEFFTSKTVKTIDEIMYRSAEHALIALEQDRDTCLEYLNIAISCMKFFTKSEIAVQQYENTEL